MNPERKPIRVLTVGMKSTPGGVENFLMRYCGQIDPGRVQFDFLTRYEDAAYPAERKALGKTWVIPRRSEDPVKYYREVRAFFEQHAKEYDVIWDNECMFNDLTPLKLAAEYGIPVRIAHSHNPQNSDPSVAGKARGTLHRMQRRMLARYANVLWACTEESARWACPALNLPFTIIPHAIDVTAFRFDEKIRAEVRAHYGLTDCLVVGQVGRLAYQKNQSFLLEAFARLHQREPRARLVLVGDGPNLLSLEAKAVALGVEDEVLFLGQRDDVQRLLMAFDLFAMPSHFEGLGMAAVEAQAAGLPCLLSSQFPQTAAIAPHVAFLPPEDPDLWAENMLDMLEANLDRRDNVALLQAAGFDIRDAAQRLTNRFEQLVAEKPSFKRRFLLTTSPLHAVDAWADKARRDVQHIAAEAGYALINLPQEKPCVKWWQRLAQQGRSALSWGKMFFTLRHGDLLLMQYPWHPVATAPLARLALHLLQWKGVSTAALVHDMNSLRQPGQDAERWSDQELLPAFDRIIVQTGRMADYLAGQGVKEDRIIRLSLFDHLAQGDVPVRMFSHAVCVVGDLSRKRSRYLHDLPRTKLQWHLYGDNWKGKASRTDITWHGGKYEQLEGTFGLVWEGNSTRVINGAQGAYMLLASPRKASLYLTQGMPLIVWRWSALASLVQEQHLGLVVENLADVPAAIAALSAQDYACMVENARAWGEKLRQGSMTLAALEKLG